MGFGTIYVNLYIYIYIYRNGAKEGGGGGGRFSKYHLIVLLKLNIITNYL